MNLLDIAIVVIIAFYIISGMYRGSISSLLSTVGFAIAWVVAQHIYPTFANMALSNQTLMAVLSQYLEPETFFATHNQAIAQVSQVIAGGESAIQTAIASLSPNLAVVSKAFEANVRAQMFQSLNINTLAEYLDQTIWQAVFSVGCFILCFIALYFLISLVVNLLDNVISFPVVRGFDWLLGGLFGFIRGMVVVVALVFLLPNLVQIVSPEFATQLTAGSKLYGLITHIDLLSVVNMLKGLIGG